MLKEEIRKVECHCCRNEFETSERNVYYCSEECKSKLHKIECKKCLYDFYHKYKNVSYCSEECKTVRCICCTKKFIAKNPNTDKYCSVKCKEIHNTRDCKYCNKSFVAKGKEKCCSKECSSAYSKIIKKYTVCKNCKTPISYAKDYWSPKFCSDKCNNEYKEKQAYKKLYKERKSIDKDILKDIIETRVMILLEKLNKQLKENDYTYSRLKEDGFTQSLKERILERDEYCCFVCERKDSLEVHHILKRRLGGTNDEDNLVTLCTKCHRAIETGNESHAISKCLKSALKYFGHKDLSHKEKLDKMERKNILMYEVNNLFKLISEDEDKSESLSLLDNLLEFIEEEL